MIINVIITVIINTAIAIGIIITATIIVNATPDVRSDTCFGFRAVHPFAWTPGSEGLSSESWLGTSGFGW